MVFNFTNDCAGLKALNTFLQDKSYISGHQISTADAAVFGAIASPICPQDLPNVARWYSHIASFALGSLPVASVPVTVTVGECKSCPAAAAAAAPAKVAASPKVTPKKAAASPKASPKTAPKKEEKKVDDDELDLFGDDDDEEADRLREERNRKALEAQAARNAKKAVVIGKSQIVIDVKPWDDTTDLKDMEEKVRSIEKDGLLWGASKLQAIGYGIKKLVISAVVEDDKVGYDDLEEAIVAFEDLVQSVDMQSITCIQQGNQIKV
eukprot:TRINITY_DN17021_c0_g1::TRINITY_DN17021_c0_g1_i1::g.13173::m.13173 TRINITY_DN17021_c0_g1::TRINITY_DN17021_c0_g1_i1::g.13173  ORF type:complete len:266 (+),score=136.02,sp/P30151/EF1B_XENLA/46.01/1e-55,EF1_GNE/PF00736.14/3.9e-28,GST_C_3/PF14497.1/8.9e-06,GST_C_2/PF13410.1/0.0018,GST_C/PF00043.20/0.0034,EF-1_beta_acid/PF10587.4/0.012,NifT/PF06988.6/2,NifT/PF06988.6/34 TRINITY_DN17021_c0_g1_i1:46-843(+)